LKSMCWPLNFKPTGIKKYDGSTNPTKWIEVYQLTIKAAGGDSYIMANYLPVCLSLSASTWLIGLPSGSVRCWTHLYWLFTSNIHATCAHLRVDWDLASIVQKKGLSLQEFIQCFCNKRNIISKVDDKSIIMFLKKGLILDPQAHHEEP
jgi:hypothetical protein